MTVRVCTEDGAWWRVRVSDKRGNRHRLHRDRIDLIGCIVLLHFKVPYNTFSLTLNY